MDSCFVRNGIRDSKQKHVMVLLKVLICTRVVNECVPIIVKNNFVVL